MIAFIKNGEMWEAEDNKDLVLDSESCIFAETVEEATEHINVHLNELYPDFNIAYIDKSWKSRNIDRIFSYSIPLLRDDVSAIRAIELIKEKIIHVKHGYKLEAKFKDELNATIHELGITRNHNSFEYNPKLAKRKERTLKRQPGPPKKHFIRIWQIESVNDSMKFAINKALKAKALLVYIATHDSYNTKTKILSCKEFFSLKNCIDNFFGKYSYRHILQFQELKDSWKKEKPKSAKSIGVTEELFDFMEKEIEKRKPGKKEFKLKWISPR